MTTVVGHACVVVGALSKVNIMSFFMYNSQRLAAVVIHSCRGWPCLDTNLVPENTVIKFKLHSIGLHEQLLLYR